ncbi:SRPBCC domain-containing protein [Nonomuraea sp. NPDC001636]|uniref:SRPBCC domain-containing protein n=1 Tax=Nonomuraea sp. NPDC001636 TaxID=3154391 RepID=UPI00331D32D3
MTYTFDTYIRATPQQVWQTFTDPELSPHINFGATIESDWRAGSRLPSRIGEGPVMVDGIVLAAEAPHRLVRTWQEQWNPAARAEPASRVIYTFTEMAHLTHVHVVHDQLDPASVTAGLTVRAWPMGLANLKTFVETGEPLGLTFELIAAVTS